MAVPRRIEATQLEAADDANLDRENWECWLHTADPEQTVPRGACLAVGLSVSVCVVPVCHLTLLI